MTIRIVLVGTTHPGNIGACARAMKNMGITDLALVDPRHFPHEAPEGAISRLAGGLFGRPARAPRPVLAQPCGMRKRRKPIIMPRSRLADACERCAIAQGTAVSARALSAFFHIADRFSAIWKIA